MAGRDLTYTVGVDASDAVGGLKKLEGAVKSTMNTVEGELDDSASAGDKFAASIDRLSSQLKEDFEKSATAAKELNRALADVDSEIDVGDAISELSRMGFTFDEITADADKFATSLKQLDDVRLDGVKELDSVAPGLATKLDNVEKSAGSSKSALANMVGNSAQDLGALGGVAGSAGVAVGQMAEYFADAAFEGEGFGSILKNFGAVAGPIAALSAGVFLLTSVVQAYGAPAREAAERTKEVGEAMDDTTSDTLAFMNVLRDNADVLENFTLDRKDGLGKFNDALTDALDFLPGVGKAAIDVLEVADRMDLSMFDLAEQLAGTGDTTDEFREKLDDAVASGKITADEAEHLEQAIGRYGDAAKQAAKDTGLFEVAAKEANVILQDLVKKADPLKTFAGSFKIIKDDMRDGAIESEVTAAMINNVAEALDLTAEQVIALAREDLDQELEDAAAAAEEAADRAEELGEAIADIVSGEDQRRLDAFTSSIEDLSDLDLAMPAIDFNQAFENKEEMFTIGAGIGAELGSAASNAAIAAMAGLSETINAQLISAFSQSGVQGMVDSAAMMRVALVSQFGPEVGNQIIQSLGISEQQVIIAAAVAVDKSELEETLAMLALLDEDSVNTKQITLKYLAGGYENDPQAFRRDVVGALEDEGATVPVALKDVDTLQDELPELEEIEVPIAADPKEIEDAAAIIADDEKWKADLGLDPAEFDTNLEAAVASAEGSDPTAILHLDTSKAMADALALKRVIQDILTYQGRIKTAPVSVTGTSVVPAPDGPTVTPYTSSSTTSSSTSNFNVTINTRATARDTVRELDRWARINGGRRVP